MRSATLVGIVGVAAAIAGGAIVATRPSGNAGGAAVRTPGPAPPMAVPDPTLVLRDRLAAMPAPRPGARNPFEFARSSAPAPAAPDGPPPAPGGFFDDLATRLLGGGPPQATLLGIATDPGADGPERTAVISFAGDLTLAKPGDTIAGRYTVTDIGADWVELTDATSGTTHRLAWR